ncbi:MAG: hypothetical protein R3280_09340 [Marinobacter sp.]|uniref:hypothetical protein n=1 Tax=Marinobacter sp. TaxID=50741 RepID=UPI00299E358B|nr:hypothetical protein [Marinobacter sp.]MDX1634828.1 hypothetical protein [Marinobacter sp.]
MTAVMEKAPGYADTAYRSNRKQKGPDEPNQQSTLFRKGWTMGPALSKGRLSYVYPAGFLDTWTPEGLRENEEREKRKGITEREERHTYYGRVDEEMLRYATLPRTSWLLLWMRHGGRVVFLMLFPITLLVWLFGWTQMPSGITFKEFLLDGVIQTFCFLLLPFLVCWGIGAFLEKKFPKLVYQEPKGPLWELNRRTGLVTLFHHPEKSDRPGEVDAQAPFHEWDGYMLSLPDHQGFIWYRLVLVHKTREWALSLNQLVPATTNREEVYAFWDLIRQYMDVTKPLPDIPLFEAYRHLDPTTAEYDRRKDREPHYWRDMDDETYKAFQRDNMDRLHRYQWG